MSDIRDYLESKRAIVENALERILSFPETVPENLVEGIRYTVFAGGKRIRPILMLSACETLAGDCVKAAVPACAIELIHTFSLIHDDLPAMDDDDLRRGKPTLHKVMGEANAILAGDALHALAYEIIAADEKLDPRIRVRLIQELSYATGVYGMVAGQVIDLASENRPIDPATLEFLHKSKTGALITASVRMGGIVANSTDEQLSALTEYGRNIGLAFQIVDDILDVVGDTESLGKAAEADETHNKATYPAVYGLDASRQKAQDCLDLAIAAINPFGNSADGLRMIASFVVARSN